MSKKEQTAKSWLGEGGEKEKYEAEKPHPLFHHVALCQVSPLLLLSTSQ